MRLSAFIVPCFGSNAGDTRKGLIVDFTCKGTSERAIKMALRRELNKLYENCKCYQYSAPWSDLAVLYTESKYYSDLFLYVSAKRCIYQGFNEL